jgi:hypothetical protein
MTNIRVRHEAILGGGPALANDAMIGMFGR